MGRTRERNYCAHEVYVQYATQREETRGLRKEVERLRRLSVEATTCRDMVFERINVLAALYAESDRATEEGTLPSEASG